MPRLIFFGERVATRCTRFYWSERDTCVTSLLLYRPCESERASTHVRHVGCTSLLGRGWGLPSVEPGNWDQMRGI